MIYALLPVLILVAMVGVTAIEAGQTAATAPASGQSQALADGQRFVLYRNAVLAYVEANPGFPGAGTGTVQTGQLSLPAGVAIGDLPAGAGNYETLSGGVRTVYVWAPGAPGAVSQMTAAMSGDATIGRAAGTTWDTPAYGTMGAIPGVVPPGDIVSVVQVGG